MLTVTRSSAAWEAPAVIVLPFQATASGSGISADSFIPNKYSGGGVIEKAPQSASPAHTSDAEPQTPKGKSGGWDAPSVKRISLGLE